MNRMNKLEAKKYFDSLLLWVHNEYDRKNKFNRNQEKVSEDKFKIPIASEYEEFLNNNYSLPQLKLICGKFDLKMSGNKSILISRIFSYLYLSTHISKIQKVARKMLIKKYILTHGPAYKNRSICVNAMDFCTMDEIKCIVPSQFFSYKDDDNFIYGFDIISFHNLIQKTETSIINNPFTKKPISSKVIMQFKELKKLSAMLKIPINLRIDSSDEPLILKSASEKANELFRYIDSLDNYTNAQWFMNLPKNKLLELVSELLQIWHSTTGLTHATRVKICHPNGNPFTNENLEANQNILMYLKRLPNLELLQSSILDILSNFVRKGINIEYNKLGAYYVLGGLTLVNPMAAEELPWLYDSFAN